MMVTIEIPGLDRLIEMVGRAELATERLTAAIEGFNANPIFKPVLTIDRTAASLSEADLGEIGKGNSALPPSATQSAESLIFQDVAPAVLAEETRQDEITAPETAGAAYQQPPPSFRKWSRPRVDLLIELRELKHEWPFITDEVNKLQGPPLTALAVRTKWRDLRNAGAISRPLPAAPVTALIGTPATPLVSTAVPAVPKPIIPQPNEWSERRREHLRLTWERGDTVPSIRYELNNFLGPALSERAIVMKAAAMNLQRPPAGVPIITPATLAQMKDWFRENGGIGVDRIPTQERVLKAVNQLRKVMGQPPFELLPA